MRKMIMLAVAGFVWRTVKSRFGGRSARSGRRMRF